MPEIESVAERFCRYARINTQSSETSEEEPSTSRQFDLAYILREELIDMGAEDVTVDEYCYVYATVPATPGKEKLPTLGFIAHMDTSPAAPGFDVRPQVHENYGGGPLMLDARSGVAISPKTYPELLDYRGCDIITGNGETLLGADDKAGIAEIMCMARALCAQDSPTHPRIRIAFTPDEEIGKGAKNFDVGGFDAAYAYTVDGGAWGDIEYENFNAASAIVTVHGLSIHPGSAKGILKNSQLIAMEFNARLPHDERPEYTSGYEGFFMLDHIEGSVEKTVAHYLVRDHNAKKFAAKKERLLITAQELNHVYGEGTIEVEIEDSYFNMKPKIEPHMHLIDTAKTVMAGLGREARMLPIRGGTDGAILSYEGLPCPNLCTGGHNYHGRFEYIPVQSMEKVVDLLIGIATAYGSK